MKLQTGYRTARWLVTVTMSLAVLTVRGQAHQSNPSQYVAIAEGNIKIDNTVNEAKITSLQIWVFEHSSKDLVAYYKPETAPDPTTDRSPVTYLLNVSDASVRPLKI